MCVIVVGSSPNILYTRDDARLTCSLRYVFIEKSFQAIPAFDEGKPCAGDRQWIHGMEKLRSAGQGVYLVLLRVLLVIVV